MFSPSVERSKPPPPAQVNLVHSGCANKYDAEISIYTGVPAGIISGAVNLSAHSNALRIFPLHASSEKYILVPVIISTRETNSNASGFVESDMMSAISHG